MHFFLVGGAVRDQLLKLPVKERDWVVVGATPEDMLGRGFIAVGKDFPVFLHPRTKEEYALARTERKVGPGYHGFEFHAAADVSLKEDLRRRDLTINAMAYDENQRLIDPWGGKRDLERKILRHVSPAFAEDPVRVLRIARFAARFQPLGFSVAAETMELIRSMSASGDLSALVPERVWRELETALGEPAPSVFFSVLRDGEALTIVLPDLLPLSNSDALFESAMHAVDQAWEQTRDKRIVFAVLVAWAELPIMPPGFLADELYEYLKTSKAYRNFARAALELQKLFTIPVVSAEDLLTFFRQTGALQTPELLKSLLSVGSFREAAQLRNERSRNARFG